MTTVDAWVLTAPRSFEQHRFLAPEIGEDGALLDVLACGLCGSDIASFLGTKDHGGPVVLGSSAGWRGSAPPLPAGGGRRG